MNTFALVAREPDAPIAYLSKPIANFGLAAGVVNTERFLMDVQALAALLARGSYAINLCENRYLFMVGFCAAITRGHTNLLPPNKNVSTQHQLSQDYPGIYIIHDGATIDESMPSIDLRAVSFKHALDKAKNGALSIPEIDNDHLACISFTSGSTGSSSPNNKYWHTLHRSTNINYRYMIPPTSETVYTLATMPAQHMWGLETSILMPLFQNVCVSDAKPLFPQDIMQVLRDLPAPRLLASTPVHLRALASSDNNTHTAEPLSLFSLLCATSPLTTKLAQQVETQFSAPLLEVYGCSEVGSMAVRRTVKQENWNKFDGIEFTQKGVSTIASAEHIPGDVTLQDGIKMHGDTHFTLSGRATDLIKIAGKRGSLLEINKVLLCFDGLQDGVIVMPDSNKDNTRLCALVALKQGIDKTMLRQYLQTNLDSAFVPRPIYVVDALPRESNGKLLKRRVDDMLATLRSK
ncbi:AMP-binding protein [Glaciecola siphonariae]|uniref:AMP-binding protein n=1 Tax=Glaciecola siphonariae TaxID=521012 RepID=A0ABV9LTZ1_9ALTE